MDVYVLHKCIATVSLSLWSFTWVAEKTANKRTAFMCLPDKHERPPYLWSETYQNIPTLKKRDFTVKGLWNSIWGNSDEASLT